MSCMLQWISSGMGELLRRILQQPRALVHAHSLVALVHHQQLSRQVLQHSGDASTAGLCSVKCCLKGLDVGHCAAAEQGVVGVQKA